MNQFLNYSVVWFQILNLFLVLLLSSFTSNSLLAPEENRKNNVHIAIDQIKSAAVRSKTWNLEHIKPDHTGRTSAELEQGFFLFFYGPVYFYNCSFGIFGSCVFRIQDFSVF